MTLAEISYTRLYNQKIADPEHISARDIVSWMGAMQAQDFSMAKLAVGVRLADSTGEKIEAAFNRGDIMRTHLMRPTWHFVTADDIYWMLELTAPQIKASLRSRHKSLELTEDIFTRSNLIIGKLLSDLKVCTREDVTREYGKAGINTESNRLSHLLLRAELDGILCSGPMREKKQTFSLLSDRVPHKKLLSREESLAELAGRYFQSHSPATVEDFSWWSGLSKKDALRGSEAVKGKFVTETFSSGKYILPHGTTSASFTEPNVHLLPAYDEFLIGYRDRSASLSEVERKRSVSANGIFYPVIVVNGQVTGIWKRSSGKNHALIEAELFRPADGPTRELIGRKVDMIGRYLSKDLEIRYL